ncbi:FAD-dependent monooxygenase [Roseospira visakhapatnamensis]|uniref:Protein FixC n=1 Tax=Roseospira visakhapatnamensis TaxID=390880 RepID=A0A7W6RCE9_9PROT|nr:FAD-dependent monooxygenase [Roseospira visakhapatnamensis]MBB4265944.1 electron transfer flavoprotein-quinone oxidoreductase [Roseospira visakhapatnamensis]
MTTEHFDAIVVGAGPAGNSATLTLARGGLKVLQIERGEYPGAKNVQGAVLYADAVEKLIPDFRDSAPLERHIIEQRIWMLDDTSYVGSHFRSDNFNEDKPNRYTILRAQFDKWFNKKVKEAGALVICETTVTGLLRDKKGRVTGVTTDRDQGEVTADVVVLADGVNAVLGTRAGLRPEVRPKDVALGVKETMFLPRETIDARFNLKGNEGVVIEAAGTITAGMTGTGFLYTNGDSLSVGIGCLISDFAESGVRPYDLLERFKRHPAIAPLIEGAEVKEYVAHMLPEGGYEAVPPLYGDGWVVAGDSAQFLNAMHREGSNLAMTSGRLAGETIVAAKKAGKKMSAKTLKAYRAALDDSFVLKDLKKYRRLPKVLETNKHFFTEYPRLLTHAAETWLRVDGVTKREKERDIVSAFRHRRRLSGLVSDMFKMGRAWR